MLKSVLAIISKEVNLEVLEYYTKKLETTSIFLITPNDIILDKYPDIVVLKDDEILDRKLYPIIEKTSRPNWYYQQFLKYAAVQYFDFDLIHIVDGDSFVGEDILFKEELFYTKKEIEKNYTKFNHKLDGQVIVTKRNYITNQMCFNKEKLSRLLKEITPKDKDWIEYMCKLLIGDKDSWLSEYQLYANYVLLNCDVKSKKINVFRRFDLIKQHYTNGLIKYSILALEPNHKTNVLRKIRARLYYCFGINIG